MTRTDWVRRWGMKAVAIVCPALLVGACERPLPTDGAAATVPLRFTAVTMGTPISTLVVQVTASDSPTPLVFNLSVVNGVASGTIKIPPGPARTIDVTALDAQGNVTHEGSATIDVRPGQNPPLQIKLRPRSGHVPITVTFGNFGVVVTPATATINVPVAAMLQLAVTVTDVNGQVIPAPAVEWATTNPAVATVSATGLVTGVANGAATLVATYEGVAALSVVAVTGASVGASQIAFRSTRDGNAEIYIMTADGTGQTRLTNNLATDDNPTWSPDGSHIALESARDGNWEVYIMNADGTGQTNVTNNPAVDRAPVWSPDGTKIAFVSSRDGNNEIYIMNADGTAQTRLTNNPAFDGDPVWSPDGTRIAFASSRDGNSEIYVMIANGSGQTRLTNQPAPDSRPRWSPDGTRIAFVSSRDGNSEIYIMKADGTGQTNLTNNPAEDGFAPPLWSPDGSKIAFERATNNGDIYIMNADGTGQTNLTNSTDGDGEPAWSPDGLSIAFIRSLAATQGDVSEIFVVSAAGSSAPVQLTAAGGVSVAPSWRP